MIIVRTQDIMDNTETPESLPPISLQPVADAQHAWVAMLLCVDPLPDADTLARLFGAGGLADALDGLQCVVPATGPATDAAAEGFVRRVPAAKVIDPAQPSGPLPPECGTGPCLALGVDSYSSFERCGKAGFTWFAGDYALRPIPGMQARNATRHALVLQLLTLITHDADSRELENLIKQDPQLSYQLLRLVNSVAFSPSHTIANFNHAITLLGRKPMQRWLQLLLYARPVGAGKSPLLPRAAFRAAFMEALFPPDHDQHAFMAGMFSLLDVMLNEPLAKLVAPLHLAVDVNRALLERSGPLGLALRAVEAAEKGDASIAKTLTEAGIAPGAWTPALIRACHWAVRVSREA
jgi:EAL and modified HD-GYP domain-containing signal transduction protein